MVERRVMSGITKRIQGPPGGQSYPKERTGGGARDSGLRGRPHYARGASGHRAPNRVQMAKTQIGRFITLFVWVGRADPIEKAPTVPTRMPLSTADADAIEAFLKSKRAHPGRTGDGEERHARDCTFRDVVGSVWVWCSVTWVCGTSASHPCVLRSG